MKAVSDNNLFKNTAYNLLGLGLPIVVAIVTIPALISVLGEERFGLLTLVWVIVSYFGLLDMGLGRALTLLLSRKLTEAPEPNVNGLIWTALVTMGMLGVVGGVLLLTTSGYWVNNLVEDISAKEATSGVFIMSAAIPLVIITSGYRGILESAGKFLLINTIRLPMGVYTFVAPLVVANLWAPKLEYICLALLFGRFLAIIPHVVIAHMAIPTFVVKIEFDPKYLRDLFSVGGWISLSNTISPIIGYVDRFLIGFILSASAVTYYVTPQEMVTKLWIVPGAVSSVIFPKLIFDAKNGRAQVVKTLLASLSIVSVVAIPVALLVLMYSAQLMSLWISDDFSNRSAELLEILCVGVAVNCLSQIPFTYIQSIGKAKVTGLLQLVQLPIFIAVLYIVTVKSGLTGAAYVWTGRLLVDSLLMFGVASAYLAKTSNKTFR